MPRNHTIDGIQVPFTEEEELARDAEEAEMEILYAARDVAIAEQEVLEAKLADDSITFTEMKKLMRLRG
jgi:hypothetical protein